MAAAAFFNAAKLADAVGRVSPIVGNIFRYLATMVTGADDKIVTGTAGTAGNFVIWDANGDAVDSGVVGSAEGIQDIVGAMVSGNTETGITVTYQDADGTLDFELVDEYIQDVVGAMVSGNTETGITVTYQDSDGTIDFAVAAPTTITVANEATDTTCFPAFFTAATGDLGPKTNANLTFNSSTNQMGISTINLTGGQITFPASQNASADANTLDDYEEGTWTPTIQDSSFSDAEGQTYTTQVGWYRKIGSFVAFGCLLETAGLGTLTTTQSARIAGLPFTPSATANTGGGMIGTEASALAITANTCLVCKISEGNTRVIINNWDAATGTTGLTLAKWSADGKCSFVGAYIASA